MSVNIHQLLVPAVAGTTINLGNSKLVLKATSEQTGDAYAVMEFNIEPGGGSPFHIHHHEDEMLYIIAGTLTFYVADQVEDAAKGAFMRLPRGIVHAFRNRTNQPVQTLITVSPGGLDQYFLAVDALSRAAATDSTIGPDDFARLNEQYGLEFFGLPVDPAV